MTTLKDVARAAGVSTATVSRVLSGTRYVSDEIRTRVLDVVDEMHYQPNGIARSLRSAKTHTIGVVVPDLSNPYFMQLVRSFEDFVGESNYHILVTSSDEQPEKEQRLLNVLTEKRVDAILLATCQEDARPSIAECKHKGISVLLADRSVAGSEANAVVEESEFSAYELVKYLISSGHRRIAIINGSAAISTVQERQRGFERAMNEAGIPIRVEYVQRGNFDQETGYIFGKRLLKMDEPPTAVFCCSNFITVGLMVAINELGLSLPGDVSIVSFGDLLLPQLIRPRLTAVIQNPQNVGRIAGRLLLDSIEDENIAKTERFVLPTHIRLGESVKVVSIAAT